MGEDNAITGLQSNDKYIDKSEKIVVNSVKLDSKDMSLLLMRDGEILFYNITPLFTGDRYIGPFIDRHDNNITFKSGN